MASRCAPDSPIVDMATGMSACNAILLALIARDRLGRGQQVEVALIDTAVAMTGFYGMAYLISGQNPGRFGNSPNGSPTVGVYQASDGPLYMACANDRLYRRLVTDVLDRPDLVTDPEFAHRKNRTANREKLRGIIAGIFASDTLENWMAKMKKANIPVGYLRTVEQGFNAPEVRGRDRLSKIPHPTAGSVPNIETPLHMSLTPSIDPVAAPLLGEHTREVLRKTLGYDDRSIAALAEAGAFGKTGQYRLNGGDLRAVQAQVKLRRPCANIVCRLNGGRDCGRAATKSPCVSPENAPNSDVFGHNRNRRWRHENAGLHLGSCAAHDFRGGLYRPAFHDRSAHDTRGELNSRLKHLGDDIHAFD